MNTVIYKAVKHLDFYYLVEDQYNKYIVDNLTRFCEKHSLTREIKSKL